MPLAPAVSALARQTIKTAYDELDRTISLGDKRDFQNTTLQHVRKAALDIENQLAARQSLRNMRRLMPLFQGLEHYSKVVDILCNGTPYLPWIWAPITLILRTASEYVEAFEQIIKGYSSISDSLKRFEILGHAFIGEPEFQQTLAVFYADILKFHKHAYKFVRRSGWKLMFLTSWGRFERRFNNILEDLKQHGSLIDQEANARDIAEARKMREDIRTWREASQSQVRRDDIEQNAKQYESIASWLKINESDQLAIFDSISSEVAEYDGTCGWVLKNPKISSWADRKPDTPALWLKGSAGTGKSVLCSQLVNFMKGSKFIIHHFCTYLYASSTMYEQILRSLLLQLLRKDGDLVAHVYKEFVLEKKSPSTPALEQLLQILLASMSSEPNQVEYIWIVIDGLDECELDKQRRLVRLINQVTSKPSLPGSTACKVLISSRAPSNSLERLRKKQIISLTEEKDCLHAAIRQYVGQRLKSFGEKLRQLDIEQPEIEEIQTVIVTKADGMFLYARLVMDYLASNIFFSGDEIKESVYQLPQKLTDFYQKILTQILIQLDPRSVDRIRCVLSWVAFAKRPLQKFELLSAITFSSGDPKIDRLAPQYILDTCGALIEERRDSTLTFIHISVKEFLQTLSSNIVIHKQQALQEHGVATIACLLSGLRVFEKTYREEDKFLRVAKGLHGFHVYATEFWTEYLLSYAVSDDAINTVSSPSLIALACQLADELERLGTATLGEFKSETSLIDERLMSLQQHAVLQKHVERALKARSLNNLESRILQANAPKENHQRSKPPLVSERITIMLASYQQVVRSLLGQNHCPGLSADELESFKIHFGTAAFTCRLGSCPRATLGFETEKLRSEHEMSHIRCFRCTFPGCQYPPFVSARALKSHTSKYHTPITGRKAIRKVASEHPNLHIQMGMHTPLTQPQLQQPPARDILPSLTENFTSTVPNDGIALPDVHNNQPIFQFGEDPANLGQFGPMPPQNEQQDSRPIERAPSPSQTNPTPPKKTPAKLTLKALPNNRDHTTDQLNPTGDEYLPCEIDEFGEKKVQPNGTLNGDREYLCRTFLVPNRGDKLFMLSQECARVLGYRDSYLFFNKNRCLFKIIASQAEKDDLVQQEILPYSYRSRQIAIVTARSMFRQFGSRIIVNGRRVRDDYWEIKAMKQGFTEADLAGEKRPGATKAREAAEAAQNNILMAGAPHPVYSVYSERTNQLNERFFQ